MAKVQLTAKIGNKVFTFDEFYRLWRTPHPDILGVVLHATEEELRAIEEAVAFTLFNPLEIIQTRCCALVQIKVPETYGVQKRKILSAISTAKKRGYRCVFVIQKESYEPKLGKMIKLLRFKKVHTYKRRAAYDKTNLIMWVKNI